MRVKITLRCSECKQRNYNTMKNKKNDPDRLEMKKNPSSSLSILRLDLLKRSSRGVVSVSEIPRT